MKKTISGFFAVFLLSLYIMVPVYASGNSIPDSRQYPRLVDYADILSENEEKELLEALDEISERQQVDVVIATAVALNGRSIEATADDFFDYGGYGFGEQHDGILLLLSMEEREWAISTTGFGIEAFTDHGQSYIIDQILPDLKSGAYDQAFLTFADLCDRYITQARTGSPYDYGMMPQKPWYIRWLKMVPFCILGGIVVALIHGLILKAGSHGGVNRGIVSVHNYMKDGIHFSGDQVQFIRREVVRTYNPPPQKSSGGGGGSSTHIGSSGISHGGSHGKF